MNAASLQSASPAARATLALRVSTLLWTDEARRGELLALLEKRRDTIAEVAFFTSFTHPPLPYPRLAHLAGQLHHIMPQFRAMGLRVGINHLSTLGHLDENLANSPSRHPGRPRPDDSARPGNRRRPG